MATNTATERRASISVAVVMMVAIELPTINFIKEILMLIFKEWGGVSFP